MTRPRAERRRPARGPAPGVFICYRRDGTSGHARALYDRLRREFGDERVFMDAEIEVASDFVDSIEAAIGGSGVMVVVIGRNWVSATGADGRRRLDDPGDFVRSEIAGALDRGISVVPVLVEGAEMPGERDLPPQLARLARIHALQVPDGPFWDVGVDQLVRTVARLLGTGGRESPPAPNPAPARTAFVLALAGALLLAVGLAVLSDTYLSPAFPDLPVPAGLFTAPAPLAILAGSFAVLGGLRRQPDALAAGLAGGFGLAAVAKGASLLGGEAARTQAGGLVWIAGGVALAAAAAVAAGALSTRGARRARPPVAAGLLGLVGAAMLVAGAFLPFNVATPGGERVIADLDRLAADPLGIAVAVVASLALLSAGRRRLGAGLLIALGLAGALLYVRYAGIPVAQSSRVAEPQEGGFVGLAGGLVVLTAGALAASLAPADAPARAPVSSP